MSVVAIVLALLGVASFTEPLGPRAAGRINITVGWYCFTAALIIAALIAKGDIPR